MIRLSALLVVGAFAGGRYAATHAELATSQPLTSIDGSFAASRNEPNSEQAPVRTVRDLVTAVHGLSPIVCGLTAEAASGWGGRSWMNAPLPPLGEEASERVAYFPRGRLTLSDVSMLLDSLMTTDACVREVAVRLIGRMEAPVVEGRLLERLSTSTPAPTRQAAVLALGLVESTAAVDQLVRLIGDDDVGVRANAVWALGRIGDKRVGRQLRASLGDPEGMVRTAAAYSLGTLEVQDATDELLRVLRADREKRVRRTAAWALGTMDVKRAGDGLVTALRSEQDKDVREMIVWALGTLEEKSAVAALSDVLRRDASEDVRESAAWALGTIEDASAAAALGDALNSDQRPEVRATAAWALGQFELREAPTGLIKAVSDANADVRTRAAWALSEIRDARAVDPLRTALQKETNATARKAQLRAILHSGERSESFFKELLNSADPEVREQAVRGLAGRGGADPWPWPMPRPRPFP